MADLTPKVITELTELTSIPDTAAFAVSSGGSSRRTLWSTIKSVLATNNAESLTANWLPVTAIRNNCGVKFIRCSGYPAQAMTSGTEYFVGTLSEAYRPAMEISAYLQVRGGTNALLTITTAGAVNFTPLADIGANQGVNFNLAYL